MVTKEDLEKIPLFSSFSDAEREEMAFITEKKELLRDAPVFNQTDPGGKLCIVHKGEVKITRTIRQQEQHTLLVKKSGDFFGGISLIDGKERSACATCVTDTEIFIIDKTDFDELARKNPLLGIKLLKHITLSICFYLRTMNDKFHDMVKYVSWSR
jgi:CRP-like cAMP-binding protein